MGTENNIFRMEIYLKESINLGGHGGKENIHGKMG
jgi:hypothetical protein